MRYLAVLIGLTLVTLACGGSAEPTAVPTSFVPPPVVITPTPEPTPSEPEPTSLPSEASKTVVLQDIGPFEDVSQNLDFVREGVYRDSDGVGGAAWFDFDSDGYLDLYLTNTRDEKNALFRNNRDGTFTNVAEQAGVTSGTGNTAVVAGDIDNDGCPDLIMTGDGAFQGRRPSGPRVYANGCDGTFSDVTETAGIDNPEISWSLALGDVNNDGFVDLFAGGLEAQGISFDGRDRLYLNNGDRTFTDITDEAGIDGDLATCATGFSYYDHDGWTDIFIANCFFSGVRFELLRNNHDLTFTDVSFDSGLAFSPSGARPDYDRDSRTALAFGDFDLDGDLDILAPGQTDKPIYENNGDGTYMAIGREGEDQASGRLGDIGVGLGVSFADFDNDGYLDVFNVTTNRGDIPGVVYMNNGNKAFTEAASYPLTIQSPSGVATGDYDNDGFADVLTLAARVRDQGGDPLLLHNRGGDNAWITIKTAGTTSNRDGIGAKVTVHANWATYVQEVRAGSGLTSNSPWLTFGLAQHDGPVDIDITWPSGLTEVFEGQPIRQIVTLTEGTGAAK